MFASTGNGWPHNQGGRKAGIPGKPGILRDFSEHVKLREFCAASGKNYNKVFLVRHSNICVKHCQSVVMTCYIAAAAVAAAAADDHGQQYSVVRGFSCRTAEFTICRGICCLPRKNVQLRIFLLHIYLIQGFLCLFLILPFIKQII